MDSNQINEDIIAKDLLRKSASIEAPDDFTVNVMEEVDKLKPIWSISSGAIISKKAWFILGISGFLVIAMVIIASIFGPAGETGHYLNIKDVDQYINYLSITVINFFRQMKIPELFPIGFICMVLMLGLDFLARRIIKMKSYNKAKFINRL